MEILSGSALYTAVGAASVQVTLVKGVRYRCVANAACWISLGTDPTAVASNASSIYVPPNVPFYVRGTASVTKVAVIQDAAAGKLSLAALVG